MRRIVLTLSTLLAAFAGPVAVAAAEPVPALGVKVAVCEVGLAAEQRAATFTGAMPAVAGAQELAMRFTLEQRRGSTWKALSPPGFSRWERSQPGAAGFVYDKRVEGLAAGASYRVTVRFRWTAAAGTVVRTATKRSATCRQPDLRPDLSIADLGTGEPLGAGRARYVVNVRNGGPSAALGGLRVTLAVDGVALAPQGRLGLEAGAVAALVFEGPACRPGGSVRAVVDAQDDVAESDEADNALVLSCPGA